MKVLLVRPDSRGLHLDRRAAGSRFGERNQPLGLLYLGTVLKLAGHEVEIADEVAGDGAEEAIARSGADLVGITVLTPLAGRAADLARAASRSGAISVVGGPHVSALPAESLIATGADIAVIGEGEKSLAEICSGAPPGGIAGLALRRDGQVVRNEPRPPEPDLDSIPFPDRSLLDLRKYAADEEFGQPLARGSVLFRMLASRGCPYGCTFCGCSTVFGRRLRHRGAGNVAGEIEGLVRAHAARTLFFVDDTFTAVPERTAAVCDAIRAMGTRVEWGCYARADTPEDLLAAMHGAGCRFVGFGVESGSPRMLERIGKAMPIPRIERTFAACRRLGIRTKAFFMVGLPGETSEDFEASREVARRLAPDFLWVSIFCPLPGTIAFAENAGPADARDLEARSYFHTRDPVILARHRRFVRSFYLRPGFLWRLLSRPPRLANLAYAARMARVFVGLGWGMGLARPPGYSIRPARNRTR